MNDEDTAYNDSKQSPESSPPIQGAEPLNPIKTAQPQADSEFQDVKRQLTGYERSTLRLTWIIVGVNLLTCIFIGLQWREMKSGSSDTHALAEAAQTQAGKMSNMSDAADKIRRAAQGMVVQDQRIADDAENTLNSTMAESQLEQRAWLAVIIGHSVPAKGNQDVKNDVDIANTGNTPAIRVQETSAIFIWPKPLLNQPPSRITNGFKFIDIPPIGPKESIRVTNEQSIASLPEWGDVKNGSKIFYFVGEVRYQDVFGKRHSTQFCLYRATPEAQFLSYCRGFYRIN